MEISVLHHTLTQNNIHERTSTVNAKSRLDNELIDRVLFAGWTPCNPHTHTESYNGRDAELTVDGCTLSWRFGSTLHMSTSFPGRRVLQALFVRFPNGIQTNDSNDHYIDKKNRNTRDNCINDTYLAVILADAMKFYHSSGKMYTVNLPFVPEKVYVMTAGMLLQPLCPTYDVGNGWKYFYHLGHPLGELQPVCMIDENNFVDSSTTVFNSAELFRRDTEKLVFVDTYSAILPIVVTVSNRINVYKAIVQPADIIDDLLLPLAPLGTSRATLPPTVSHHSSVGMQLLYMMESNNVKSDLKVFTAHDYTRTEVLCIRNGEILTVWSINIPDLSTPISNASRSILRKLHEWRVIATEPVEATRGPGLRDILFVDKHHTCLLWDGYATIECKLPIEFQQNFEPIQPILRKRPHTYIESTDLPLSALGKHEHTLETFNHRERSSTLPLSRIIDLCDGVCNRISVTMSNGHRYRLLLDFTPKCTLTSTVLKALDGSLSTSDYFTLKQQFCVNAFGALPPSLMSDVINKPSEFDHLATSLLHLLNIIPDSTTLDLISTSSSMTDTYSPIDRFEQMSSSYNIKLSHLLPRLKRIHSMTKQSAVPSIRSRAIDTVISNKQMSKRLTRSTSASLFTENSPAATLHPLAVSILQTLHLVYEQLYMNTLRYNDQMRLGRLLSKISCHIRHDSLYYERCFHQIPSDHDNNIDNVINANSPSLKPLMIDIDMPYLLEHFVSLLSGHQPPTFPFNYNQSYAKRSTYTKQVYSLVERVVTVFEMLSSSNSTVTFDRELLQTIDRVKLTLRNIENLPSSLQLILYAYFSRMRNQPPRGCSASSYRLIKRPDIAINMQSGRANHLSSTPSVKTSYDGNENTATCVGIVTNVVQQHIGTKVTTGDTKGSTGGGSFLDIAVNVKFRADQRVHEIHKLLYPQRLPILQNADLRQLTDPGEISIEQQRLLQILSRRTSALPFGRSAFSYSCRIPAANESVEFTPLDFSAKFGTNTNTSIELETIKNDSGFVDINALHDGVTRGLQIARDITVEESWLWFIKPAEMTTQFAGFILGLGINGHLCGLSKILKAKLFSQEGSELTEMAIILGLAASHSGTADADVLGIIAVYLPYLRSYTSTNTASVDTTSVLFQAVCIFSFGLLLLGKPRPGIEDYLLTEVGRVMFNDDEGCVLHRTSYSLAAGMSCGLVFLGMGKTLSEARQTTFVLRLKRYMHQRHEGNVQTLSANSHQTHDSYKTSAEDVSGTAYGAMVAFGLVWLRSNEHDIATHLQLPGMLTDILALQPDQLMFRIICYYLIMWSQIVNTVDWVEEQVSLSIHERLITAADLPANKYPHEAVIARHYIVAGACYAIALRYLGTGDETAAATITKYLRILAIASTTEAKCFLARAARRNASECLNVTVIALGMVMASTGDIKAMRLFRTLYNRLDADTTFGSHLATHTAMGLLLLAGGDYSLMRSNKGIAAALCALFPRFPSDIRDNSVHVIMLRHLWPLAVDTRLLSTIDIQTRAQVALPICFTYKDRNRQSTTHITPCAVLDLHLVTSVTVNDERYYSYRYDTSNTKALRRILQSGILFVQRKLGYAAHNQDPKYLLAPWYRYVPMILLPPIQVREQASSLDFARNQGVFGTLVSHDKFLNFALSILARPQSTNEKDISRAHLITELACQCIAEQHEDWFTTQLQFGLAQLQLEAGTETIELITSLAWDLRLLSCLNQYKNRETVGLSVRDTIRQLNMSLTESLRRRISAKYLLAFWSGETAQMKNNGREALGALLVYFPLVDNYGIGKEDDVRKEVLDILCKVTAGLSDLATAELALLTHTSFPYSIIQKLLLH